MLAAIEHAINNVLYKRLKRGTFRTFVLFSNTMTDWLVLQVRTSTGSLFLGLTFAIQLVAFQ